MMTKIYNMFTTGSVHVYSKVPYYLYDSKLSDKDAAIIKLQ